MTKTDTPATVTLTADEIDGMIARGETRSDWGRAAATTEEDLQRQAASDPDLAFDDRWLATARAGVDLPQETNKQQVTLRLDPDILGHFKQAGRGWQTRINAVLRSYVESRR